MMLSKSVKTLKMEILTLSDFFFNSLPEMNIFFKSLPLGVACSSLKNTLYILSNLMSFSISSALSAKLLSKSALKSSCLKQSLDSNSFMKFLAYFSMLLFNFITFRPHIRLSSSDFTSSSTFCWKQPKMPSY